MGKKSIHGFMIAASWARFIQRGGAEERRKAKSWRVGEVATGYINEKREIGSNKKNFFLGFLRSSAPPR
jgi:hypothetical protein